MAQDGDRQVGPLTEQALRFLRDLGATRVRLGELEVVFGPEGQASVQRTATPPPPIRPQVRDPQAAERERRRLALASSGLTPAEPAAQGER